MKFDDTIVDEDGIVQRYHGNRIVRYLLDTSDKVNLNQIWMMYHNSLFTEDEMKEFYKMIGYSLTDYNEIFNCHPENVNYKGLNYENINNPL